MLEASLPGFAQNSSALLRASALSGEGMSYKEPPAWVILGGGGSYIAGAAVGGYAARLLFPPSTSADTSFSLRVGDVVGGVLGGSLASATFVHVANGGEGNLPLTASGALLAQAAFAGGFSALLLFGALIDSPKFIEAVGWLGWTVAILGTPFVATLTADYVDYRTGRR